MLAKLTEAIEEELKAYPAGGLRAARRQWAEQIAEWKRDQPLRYEWDDDVIKPQYVIEEISNLTDGEALIVTGVGQHQMWAAQYYRFKHPRAWCTSGGLGTMGYGLPCAMGVQAGNPGKLVINIDGDGSFAMNSQELATCFEERLPVKVVIINNGGHGMVRQWQRIIYKERFCAVDLKGSPDFVQAGRGLRLHGHPRDQAERRGAGAREDDRHAGAGRARRVGQQGRVRVPDGAGGRRQHGHDPGPPEPRGPGARGEVADRILSSRGPRRPLRCLPFGGAGGARARTR